MKIIDAHTHVLPHYADLAVAVMDRCNIESYVVLAWHDGFGPGLDAYFDAFSVFPGRFHLFGNLDFSTINEPRFGEREAERLERDVRRGLCGLKVYKNLGLSFKRTDGTFWRPNDFEFDPIWAKAGELGIPVLIHSADPGCFWEPTGELNQWGGVLQGEYAWWSYYGKGLPSPNELLGERQLMAAKHPRTTFIFPHCGEKADSLDLAAEELDRFPNVYYDLSARLPDMASNERRARHAREFVLAYSDRILFGTDVIYDDTNVPTGQQAQILHQPGAIPLGKRNAAEVYVETTVQFTKSNRNFYAKSGVEAEAPFVRKTSSSPLHRLDLPVEALECIYALNARKLIPMPT